MEEIETLILEAWKHRNPKHYGESRNHYKMVAVVGEYVNRTPLPKKTLIGNHFDALRIYSTLKQYPSVSEEDCAFLIKRAFGIDINNPLEAR